MPIRELSIGLGIAAALLNGIAYFTYNKQAKKGDSDPSIASWAIWVLLTILIAMSYAGMLSLVLALPFFIGATGRIVTFSYMLAKGKFSWPTLREWGYIAIGAVATLVWLVFKSAAGANIIVLVAFLISFVPTVEDVAKDPFKETPRAWELWAGVFCLMIANLLLTGKGVTSFITPVAFLAADVIVAVLSSPRRKTRFLQRSNSPRL